MDHLRIARVRTCARASALLLGAFVSASACGDDEDGAETAGLSRLTEADYAAVKEGYAELVHTGYREALEQAKRLETAIAAFLAAPSEAGFEAARQAWKAAREPYGQTEAYRFYGGPIDEADEGPEGQINAWPLDESYVDYVDGLPGSGIINDLEGYPEIDEETIIRANEAGGTDEKAISTGYHAIEFLLWGQDRHADGPGQRSWRDYLVGDEATHAHGDRRGTYLRVATARLIADLESLVAAWAPAQENYRKDFVALPEAQALRRILTGMGVLSSGELAGERMDVALDTRDQEDEHSCFSDNTHRDVVNNARGIENVYLGRWGETEVAGLADLLSKVDTQLAETLTSELRASVVAAEAIPAPFDQAINDDEGRAKIQATIDALRRQAATIVRAATRLGVENLTTDLPE